MRISDWSSDVCSSDLKDRARPFVVEVGDVRVRAVGTAFGVKRTAGGVDVQVTEGVVEVWRVGDEGHIQRVAAGSRVFVAPDKAIVPVVAASEEFDKARSEEHTSELQSLMRISYAVF